MTRRYKTSQKKREQYVYYSNGKKVATIIPGEDGVTEVDIERLHSEDDQEVDEQRRHDYGIEFNFESFMDDDGNLSCDSNKYLEDKKNGPSELLIEKEIQHDKQNGLENLFQAIEKLQPQQQELIQKKFFKNRTNVDIAAEEGVTEAAIRNRLTKIYRRLEKLIAK